MRKFLSILLAVAMVFSLVVVARVPTASAAISGLRSPATDTGLPTYTMGELITGKTGLTTAADVYLGTNTSYPPTAYLDKYSAGTDGNFVLRTSATKDSGGNPVKEGIYYVNVSASVYQPIYLKYNITQVSPATAPSIGSTSLVSGKLYYGDTQSTPVADGVKVILACNSSGSWQQVAFGTTQNGFFSFYATFANAGNYALFVDDGYPSTFTFSGAAIYYSWTVGPSQLVINLVVQPTLLYANGTAQTVSIYVTDTTGAPVQGLALTVTHVAGVVAGLGPVTDLGSGFYSFTVTPSSTTIGSETIKLSTASAVGYLTLNYLQPGAWNPQLLVVPASMNGFGIDQQVIIAFSQYTDPSSPWLFPPHYVSKKVTGPVKFVSGNNYVIQTGGTIGFYVKEQLWSSSNPLTTKTKVVEQSFTVYPPITSDQVTYTPTSILVDSTTEVDVTVKMANGVERNNGKVVLVGPDGMFTVPSGAAYYLDTNDTNWGAGKDAVVLDAVTINQNIVGGVYKFPGLKFNKVGSIDVRVYGSDGTTLTSVFYGAISVTQKEVTLTSSVSQFVIGKIYPSVTVSGAVPGLTFTCSPTGIQIADNGDGSYVFNFATPIPGDITISATSSDGKTVYSVTIKAVKPTLKVTSIHKDKLITAGFPETVKFDLIDPETGNTMSHTNDFLFVEKVTDKTDLSIYDLPVSSLNGGVSDASVVGVVAGYGNPLVASKDPMLGVKTTVNGVTVSYDNVLKVADPSFTVTPKNLVLYTGTSNKFSVDVKDAHGVGLEAVPVRVEIPSDPTLTAYTDVNGHAAFTVSPNYEGEGYIHVGTLQTYTFQIVPAPKDTTPPTLTVTAPADKSTVNTPTVKVTGKATDNVGVTGVYVNDVPVTLLPDGTFATTVTLAEGANTIVVKAFDAAGNVATQTLTVTYQKPAPTGTKIVLKIGSDIMAVNDRVVQLDAAPEIKEGRTFLPLRAIAEAFGAQVTWVPETQGITVVLGNNQIGLQIGNNTAVVNGNVLSIVPPYIKNGRTMVPIRVIAEGFGAKVEWDPINYIITITMP
jgi:hypothetical protein